jgi:hypothetical protein
MQTTVNQQSNQASSAPAVPASPSIDLASLGVPVSISTDTGKSAPKTAAVTVNFTPKLSVELAESDDQSVVAKTRPEYVVEFKKGVEKTARATLEMCRVVYEAHKSLDNYEFANFCREIGLKDWSSTVRKFIAIGKVYPRFIQYADQLPASWTSIYLITQIPADTFNECLERAYPLKNLKGRELADLLNSTKEISSLDAPLSYDKTNGGYLFGKVMFTKKLDDIDWRAMEKAFNEIEARLPIKIVVHPEMLKIVEQRKLKRYEATKEHHKRIELKPDLWDLGKEANAMYDSVKPTTVEQVAVTA